MKRLFRAAGGGVLALVVYVILAVVLNALGYAPEYVPRGVNPWMAAVWVMAGAYVGWRGDF